MTVKMNSSKLLPFQARIARRQRYEYTGHFCTNVDHAFNNFRVNYRYFTNQFGQRALLKYIEVLTFHFPCLYGPCSHSQQLRKSKHDATMFTHSSFSRQFERYLEPDIVKNGTKLTQGEGFRDSYQRVPTKLTSGLRYSSHRRLSPSPRKAFTRSLEFLVGC